jgi:predicted ATPase
MSDWISVMFLNELAAGFARAGHCASGGELLLLQAAAGAATAAEDHFGHALDWARRQGALSLELRAATSLAQLWRDQHRAAEARALLHPVYDRFTDGFDTTDPKAAKALLDALAESNSLRGGMP